MRWSLLNTLNCASGPIRQLTPATRIVVTSLVFIASVVTQPANLLGFVCLVVTALGWLIVCGPPFWLVRSALVLALAMLLPVFLLSPLIEAKGHFLQALTVPWTLFARGIVGMLVSITALSALTLSELQEGLRTLKVPALVVTLVVQIIHQAELLIDETRRISAALSLRRGPESTMSALRILGAMPQVWLPRVIHRAERLAMTMELRGYGIDVPYQSTRKTHWRDVVSIALAGCWALIVLFLQNRIGRS